MRQITASVLALGVLSGAAVVADTVATAPVAEAAPTPVRDPGRNRDTPVGWWWLHGVSMAKVKARVEAGYRLVDLEVERTGPLRVSAAFVKNKGHYKRGWWWYYGLTANQVKNKINLHNGRLIDIESYPTSKGRRYAVVMVKNAGKAKKSWWWFHGQTLNQVVAKAGARNARVIDTNRYLTPSGWRYAVIMVKNVGVDQSGWWHYYNVTPNTIKNKLDQHKARLIDIERKGSGRFDVVMVKRTGEYWWWYTGLRSGQIQPRADQHAARIYRIEPYRVNGKKRFAIILISNANQATSKVRAAMEKGLSSGDYGAYLRQVGGPTLINLNVDHRFETASTIKVAHHLAAHEAWRDDPTLDINSIIPWRAHKDAPARYPGDTDYGTHLGRCAYDNAGNDASDSSTRYRDQFGPVLLTQMMMNSDNRTTDAVLNLLGFGAINASMAGVGMTDSELRHRIGCAAAASPQPWKHNRLTLRDAGRLYEAVADGSALGVNSQYQQSFYDLMLGGSDPSADGWLGKIIAEEGAKRGLSAAEIADFRAQTRWRGKGGSYDICPDDAPPCAPPYWWVRSSAGTLWVPFKNSAGRTFGQAFVHGRFADEIVIDCDWPLNAPACNDTKQAGPRKAMNGARNEVFRTAVRRAMATW